MGRFDRFLDSPGRIKTEGQEISLVFQRTSDNTGILTWNIPAPSAGCDADSQAYNGIVITVASQPANYLTTSPVDGTYYKADPSVDPDINIGGRLDNALVIGAFYDDKTTTLLNITDLTSKTSYYFSAYAVDNVARYHREGVHSYSLPTGPEESNGETDTPAIQDIGIDVPGGIDPTIFTGLEETKNYTLTIAIDKIKYPLSISGTLALDYGDLIDQLNQEFIRITEPKFTGSVPPNTNSYYVDIPHSKIYQWDGFNSNLQTALFQNDDPSTPIEETLWYNPTVPELFIYQSGVWVDQPYKISEFDFSNPSCYKFWFDGTNVYKWEKVIWAKLPTYVSDTNPLTPAILDCNTFWYNSNTSLLMQWDTQLQTWNNVNAIYTDIDPNTISSGAYWYNQTDGNVYYYAGATWNKLNNITYADPDSNGNYVGTPFANIYWFVPSTQKLFRRDIDNTVWVELDVILYNVDPTIRTVAQLWWDSINDILNIWDTVNSQWVQVSLFFQQALDPSVSPDIPLNSAWYNSTTKVVTIINNPDCTPIDYVFSVNDPRLVQLNDIWYEPTENIWNQWNGSGWSQIGVISNPTDPYVLTVGELWFNTAALQLNIWDGAVWNITDYSNTPITQNIGDLWFEPMSQIIYEWDGATWTESIGIAAAKLILRTPFDCTNCTSVFLSDTIDTWVSPFKGDLIRLYTKKTGCNEKIQICFDDGITSVFNNVTPNVIYFPSQKGYSALPAGPTYQHLGVGTDGSPDERRQLHNIIRSTLGDPSAKVELTKEQIDTCIDNALKMLRKNSNLGYKRGFFFLDVFQNQQVYFLKDKCVGFNKIVDINTIYRTRAGIFGSSGFSGDGLFAWSALTQLYSLGTFDMLSFHLVSSYVKDLQTLFADWIMFQWVEGTRELKMFKEFYGNERVLIDGTIERTEQDLLTNRETTLWLQKWSTAEAKLMLGNTRGKFTTLPGPNGNTTLNAQDLISQANDEMTKLEEQLFDPVLQDMVDIGMRAHFVIG